MRPFIALPNYCGDGAPNHSGVIVIKNIRPPPRLAPTPRSVAIYYSFRPICFARTHRRLYHRLTRTKLENRRIGDSEITSNSRFRIKHSTAMLHQTPANASAQCLSILRPSEETPVITAILMESSKPPAPSLPMLSRQLISSSSFR
jgi:hypothetical protein